MSDSEKKTLQQSLRDAWLGVLGVLSHAEGEAARVGQRILEAVGLGADSAATPEDPTDTPTGETTPSSLVSELIRRVRRNQEALERRVDDEVRAAVSRMRLPIIEELAVLRSRVEQLQSRIEALRERRRAREAEPAPPPDVNSSTG